MNIDHSQLTKSDAPLPPAHNCSVYDVKTAIDGLPEPSANCTEIVFPDMT